MHIFVAKECNFLQKAKWGPWNEKDEQVKDKILGLLNVNKVLEFKLFE